MDWAGGWGWSGPVEDEGGLDDDPRRARLLKDALEEGFGVRVHLIVVPRDAVPERGVPDEVLEERVGRDVDLR